MKVTTMELLTSIQKLLNLIALMLHFLPTGELVLYLSSTAQILNICSIIATMHVIKSAKYYIIV